MRLRSIFTEAGQALRFNRQRSVLTVISLAWGVACFVILYSYGDGFHVALSTAFRAVGQDLVLMYGGQTSKQAGGERAGRRVRLQLSDVDSIHDTVPMVAAISPEVMIRGASVVLGYRTQTLTIRGVRPAYGRMRNMTLASGRWLGPDDELSKQRVAVIGSEAAKQLFGEIPPEGEEITIAGLRFTIVGLLKTKTQISNYNTPDNNCLFIPYQTSSLLRDIRYLEAERLGVFVGRSLDIDVLLDLMIHDLNLVLSLLGSKVKEVRAVGVPVLTEKVDITNVRLELENGAVANLTASRVSQERVRKVRFFSSEAYISVDTKEQEVKGFRLKDRSIEPIAIEVEKKEPLRAELESFLECVATRSRPLVSCVRSRSCMMSKSLVLWPALCRRRASRSIASRPA